MVNCVQPAAVNGRLQTCQRVVDLIHGALAQAVPERVMAGSNGACTVAYFIGQRPHDDAIWVYLETIGGGSGARATKDGLDGVHVHITNTSNLPVEALEIEYPLTLMRYELVDGSGGAGRYRGGMGLRRVYRAKRIAACASISPVSARGAGACSAAVPAAMAGRSGTGRGLRGRRRRAEGRAVVRPGHAGCRRLWPAGRASRGPSRATSPKAPSARRPRAASTVCAPHDFGSP